MFDCKVRNCMSLLSTASRTHFRIFVIILAILNTFTKPFYLACSMFILGLGYRFIYSQLRGRKSRDAVPLTWSSLRMYSLFSLFSMVIVRGINILKSPIGCFSTSFSRLQCPFILHEDGTPRSKQKKKRV